MKRLISRAFQAEWDRWKTAGIAATSRARAELKAAGADVIYEREGILYAEHPDGSVDVITAIVGGESGEDGETPAKGD